MTPSEIADQLTSQFGSALTAVHTDDKHPRVHINVADWSALANYLRHDPALAMDWLACLTGLDYAADDLMCVAYDFKSSTHHHQFAIKVYAPRSTAIFPTVNHLWPAANWHEREAFDLFGIEFRGHPDPRRILLSDDWIGHPLKKDYEFPRAYHDIPASVELDWQQQKE